MIEIPDEPEQIDMRIDDYIWCIYGAPGVGKSTFVKQLFGAARILFVSTDRGTRDMKVRRVEVNDWKSMRKVFKLLAKPKGVEVIAFDHVDDIVGYIETYVCQYYSEKSRDGVVYETIGEVPHGKGWAMFKSELNSLVHRTLRLGFCPVFIAHEDIKTVIAGGREQDKIMPSMSKMAQKAILPICGIIGQITFKKLKVDGKRGDCRVLVTQPRDDLYVKDRSSRLKPDHGWEMLDAKAIRESFNVSSKAKGRRAKGDE